MSEPPFEQQGQLAEPTWRVAPPVDVVAWMDRLDEHDRKSESPVVDGRRRARIRVVRRTGPQALDAELVALTPTLRECFQHSISDAQRPTLLRVTFRQATTPVTIIDPESPHALTQCVSDAIISELVHPLSRDAMTFVIFAAW